MGYMELTLNNHPKLTSLIPHVFCEQNHKLSQCAKAPPGISASFTLVFTPNEALLFYHQSDAI